MYKVLLVDDDPIVLALLRHMLDWNNLNCELLGEAGNGRDAIRIIDKNPPDIVITDISMPGMSGMDLIHSIGERYGEQIRTIAISAFDDFQYVRESLKGGASDYLLKHQITKEILEKAVQDVIVALDTGKQGEDGYSIRERKEHLIYLLLQGREDSRRLSLMKELGMEWLSGKIMVVLGKTEGDVCAQDEDTVRVFIEETIKYNQAHLVVPLEKGGYLLFFSMLRVEDQDVMRIVEQVQASILRFCNVEMSFVLGNCLENCEAIKDEVRKLDEIMEKQYFHGKKAFILADCRKMQTGTFRWGSAEEKQLIKSLEDGEDMEKVFDDIFAEMGEMDSKSRMQIFYVEVIRIFVRKLEEQGVESAEIFGESSPYEIYMRMETLQELKKYLAGIFTTLQEIILRNREADGYSDMIRCAIAYIEDHYREKISLSVIAREISVSASYLSRIFKKATGVNVVSYINQVRMRHAKEMIDEGQSGLCNIPFEVGISNYNYFYILFKEVYGMTPSEYLKKATKE